MDVTTDEATDAARSLTKDLPDLSHSRALEIVAHQLGFGDWKTAAAALPAASETGRPVPVLRIFDEGAAREVYQEFLGFTRLWDHRFEPGLPLYRRIGRNRAVLDLSEHHGDGTPGSVVWLPVADVSAWHTELAAKDYPGQRPGIDQQAPGGPTLSVTDPFGNVLRFCQQR